jgi:PadR family transcriptional regulator, regulatory protein AphA
MGSTKLAPISYTLLGLLEMRGPSTPYELKRSIEESVGYFWTFSHQQFYAEPTRLAAAGLMKEQREESGRRRRTFSITAEGRRALRDWLAEPSTQRRELRDPGMLKLFFAELARPEDVEDLRHSQEQLHRTMIAELEDLQKRYGSRQDLGYRADTIQWGLSVERSLLNFWKKVDVRLEKARPARRARRAASK